MTKELLVCLVAVSLQLPTILACKLAVQVIPVLKKGIKWDRKGKKKRENTLFDYTSVILSLLICGARVIRACTDLNK